MLPPAQLLPFAATSSDTQLIVGSFLLRGWSFLETTGAAAAAVNLTDGADSTAPVIASVALAQGTTASLAIPEAGLLVRTGIWLDVTAGSVSGSVWIIPLTTEDDHSWAHGEYGLTYIRPGV